MQAKDGLTDRSTRKIKAKKENPAKAIIQQLLKNTGIVFDGPNPWDPQIHNEGFYQRVLHEGSLGLGESYMEGWWDCAALEQLFAKVLRLQLDKKIKYDWRLSAKIFLQRLYACLLNPQNQQRSLKVGRQHYDIGNDLYQLMLDPGMSYTCAYWSNAKTLEAAQLAKLELICQKLQLQKGMRLLDIGCGFGGMAEYAARNYGVEVVGITISKEQARLAKERNKGLPVEIRFQDYRSLKEQFDRVVSIGMFEHVGPKNYATYMKVVASNLKDDGLFLLHTIGGNISTKAADPWINQYIFPNGVIPSIQQIGASIEGCFVMEDWHNFGFDYYTTLMAWHENFVKNYPQLKARYDEKFYRMWKYYLLSCAGTFYARDCQLWQIVLSKYGVKSGYIAPR